MITELQRTARKQYLGSSDMAAVMGLDTYKSAKEVWYEKTGRDPGFSGNAATERGNLLEPVLMKWAELELSRPFDVGIMKVVEGKPIATNFDGIWPSPLLFTTQTDLGEPFIVEGKSSCLPEEWGDPGTDEVPERTIIQTHTAMYVAGPAYRIAYVPVLLPLFGRFVFRMYEVHREEALCEAIAEQACDFWERYVIPDIEPEGPMVSLEVMKRVRREPNKVVDIPDALVDAWISCKAAKKQAEDDAESAQAAILATMADAEGGKTETGRVLTYLQTSRKAYSVEASKYRQLRLKAVKGK